MAPLSRSRPSTTSDNASRVSNSLPTYQPPSHPLNDSALRNLETLQTTHNLNSLIAHFKTADDVLSHSAAEINDRYFQRAENEQGRKARRAQRGIEEDEEARKREQELEEMREQVEDMTRKMEGAVRGIIDAQARVDATKAALGEVHGNVVAAGGMIAPTQSTLGASQFRGSRRRPRRADSEGEESEDDEENGSRENVGAMGLLKRKLEEHEERYGALSMRSRYATHNSYIGFKKFVHDATHPGPEAPPLPNASTWFPADSRDPANVNHAHTKPSAAQHADDDESDLEVASERISIKCPLTLLSMKDPVSSTKCPHSFEKEAILGMIARSATTVAGTARRGGAERAIKCPVCEVMLTPSNLRSDPILIRKIKRLQATQAQDMDDDLDDSVVQRQRTPGGTQMGPEVEVGSDDETEGEGSARRSWAPRVKREKSLAASTAAEEEATRVPPSTRGTIVDLEVGSEDEDDEDVEEEE